MDGSTGKNRTCRFRDLDAVEIIMSVEMDCGINFAEINFGLTLLD
jgi:hypothetical protein